MKTPITMPTFKVQVLRKGRWQTIPGGFSTSERAKSYGEKYYNPDQYRVVEGRDIPKYQEA